MKSPHPMNPATSVCGWIAGGPWACSPSTSAARRKWPAFSSDNYYYTGDRASFDADGYWWFVGRADDVIKSSDYRVGPSRWKAPWWSTPVRGRSGGHRRPRSQAPPVGQGLRHSQRGFEPSKELALDLFKHTIGILAKFKIPRIIEFVTEVPKTISGKIRRIELRENEVARKEKGEGPQAKEYFYWDFPELSSKKRAVSKEP
jgi:4-hydroxybutyrate---CoA ligase (AMP-forming)